MVINVRSLSGVAEWERVDEENTVDIAAASDGTITIRPASGEVWIADGFGWIMSGGSTDTGQIDRYIVTTGGTRTSTIDSNAAAYGEVEHGLMILTYNRYLVYTFHNGNTLYTKTAYVRTSGYKSSSDMI